MQTVCVNYRQTFLTADVNKYTALLEFTQTVMIYRPSATKNQGRLFESIHQLRPEGKLRVFAVSTLEVPGSITTPKFEFLGAICDCPQSQHSNYGVVS
jgi:hypothetical protein